MSGKVREFDHDWEVTTVDQSRPEYHGCNHGCTIGHPFPFMFTYMLAGNLLFFREYI